MKSLLRWAFSFSAAVSAILLVAVAVLGVRSLYRLDVISRITAEDGFRVASIAGTLHFGDASRFMYPMGLHWESSQLPELTTDWHWLYPSVQHVQGRFGFAVVEGSYEIRPAWVFYRVVVVPDWAVAAICAVFPIIWLLGLVRRRIPM